MVIKFISNLMKLIISIIIIILNLYSPSFFMFLIPSNKIYCFSLIVIICFSNLLMMMMMMMMIFPLYLVEKINKRKERKITVSGLAGTRT
jgi:formate-dependent nitrite reductase membrane component NrfD